MTTPVTEFFKEPDLTHPNYSPDLALIGVTGSLHYAPLGTKPIEKMGLYVPPWVDAGWISDDGVTEQLSRDSSDFTPWQSVNAIRTQTTKEEYTFKTVLWSVHGLAMALYYGVPEDEMVYDAETGITSFEQGQTIPEDRFFAMNIDIVDGQKARRFAMPRCQITDRDDVTYKRGEMTGYGVTLKATLDQDLGYAIKREFREGWKPGHAGTTLGSGGKGLSLGEWHTPIDTVAGDGKTYLFSLKGATGGVWKLTVGTAVVENLTTKMPDEKIQEALRKAGEANASVSGNIESGFVVSGVSAKPDVDVTKLDGVNSVTVTELP